MLQICNLTQNGDEEGNDRMLDEVMYGNNKLEYALSTKDYMASISVLPDFTYDFFAVEIEREDTIMVKTRQYDNIEGLFRELKEDISSFANLKKV
jgi:hypothetical protein